MSIADDVESDIRLSPRRFIIYLEGKDDLECFCPLLGHETPSKIAGGNAVLFDDVLIKKCDGSHAVRLRVQEAARYKKAARVIGIVDGDGRSYEELKAEFDDTPGRDLFAWKAYSIENLLVKLGSPEHWGEMQSIDKTFQDYRPYVVLNHIRDVLNKRLESIDLNPGMAKPNPELDLITVDKVIATFEPYKKQIAEFDLPGEFQIRDDAFQEAVARGHDELHALVNGKWFVEHWALKHLKKARPKIKLEEIRSEWCDHAIQSGGLPEVRDWWQRVTGLTL